MNTLFSDLPNAYGGRDIYEAKVDDEEGEADDGDQES